MNGARTCLVLWGLTALILGGAMALSGCERRQDEADVKTITVWSPFSDEAGKVITKLVASFEKTHPGIHIKLSYASGGNTSNPRLFLAIAGGTPPDVTFIDGQQVTEFSSRGALTDITEQVRKARLGADDFWLPSWKECNFNGRVHCLPWGSDPNFAFVWNKKLFREAGLDPERPPRTIQELDEYDKRLTKTDAQGRIVNIGFIPWQWGGGNTVFTWGYAFGGDFYRPPPEGSRNQAGRVTANDPHVVEAMRWIQRYARQYDVRKINAFNGNFVGVANNPFYIGHEAMCLLHVAQVRDLHRYAPTLECGVSYIPTPPEGEHPTGWIGGWALGIPRGAPPSAEAFEFIRWMCASPQATAELGKELGQFSAYRKNPYFATIQKDPILSVFYQILLHAKHTRTLMPAQNYLMILLDRGMDDIIYGQRDPQSVLDEVTAKAQKRLDEVMARVSQLDATPQGARDSNGGPP